MFRKKSLADIMNDLLTDEQYKDQISFWHTINEKDAAYAPFPDDLHEQLRIALEARGISS